MDVYLIENTRNPSSKGARLAEIFPDVYDELRRLARRQLLRESQGHTLDATALVHEAYIKLSDQTRARCTGRAHLMALAATAMRRILIDRARKFHSQKRGGGLRRVPFESVELAADERADILLALNDALDDLKEFNERQAQIVECRFFGGLTEEETAAALGTSVRTVKRDWAKAKIWLYQEMICSSTSDSPLKSSPERG